MKKRTYIALALGLGLVVWLVWRIGAADIFGAMQTAGWGVLAVAAWRFLPMTTDALSWRRLMPAEQRPARRYLVRARWIGESVNHLLPVAHLGGHVVRARLAHLLGLPGPRAGASVVVDVTVGMISQSLYTLAGALLLFSMVEVAAPRRTVVYGVIAAAAVIAGFILVQHRGLFGRLAGVVRRRDSDSQWRSLVGGAAELDAEVVAVYSRRGQLARAFLWRVATKLLHAGETWLILYLLGVEIGYVEALILDSLGTAARFLGFAIPGGLGMQEGGFLVVGQLLGLTAETALAVALIRRVRELLVGGPGLLVWAAVEHQGLRRLLSSRQQ
jgi:putative membrane protein